VSAFTKFTYDTTCACLLFFIFLLSNTVYAARPLIVDDARIVDRKACQVESWTRKNTGSYEFWALPSCNFTGNFELTAGSAAIIDDTAKNPNLLFQGKTLFKRMKTNGWGIGLAVGAVHNPTINVERNLTGDLYAYIPTSFSFLHDRLFINTNIGWLYRRSEQGAHHITLGIGTEILITGKTWFIAETFGQSHGGNPFFHVGVRQWVKQDHVQIDATYGNRFISGIDEQWFTLGLRLITPAFLP
jgi:hypothetical protein